MFEIRHLCWFHLFLFSPQDQIPWARRKDARGMWTCWCKISAIWTATVLGSSLSHLTPDIQVYVDVDDMKHLASGHGQKHRVDEIILPQKAYKGGGSENWTKIWTPLIQNLIDHIDVIKTFWEIITYPVCPGQYGEYGGYDFLLIKVCHRRDKKNVFYMGNVHHLFGQNWSLWKS